MHEDEPPLSPVERLVIAALYARLTSLDVLHPRQHPRDDENSLVGGSHILVSVPQSHNLSHREVR